MNCVPQLIFSDLHSMGPEPTIFMMLEAVSMADLLLRGTVR